ncbi:MAG TPA: helix-turn-helix transcriptional regulator [Caulobacterales bacterium]|jgi:phage repressor protein C with HTH and peptisase S24 domain|nr:helix-turn-helix transcriptional regulator [Caulobacterales bacterium]
MDHAGIWRAIDALAARHNLTASGLARAAGLDPTTFNKSKRVALDGKLRWPSTESIARALAAVGADFEDFAAIMTGGSAGRAIALVDLAKAGGADFFDERGLPIGARESVRFPGLEDAPFYALEISGEMGAPAFREGGVVIVQPAAPMRRGDRVLLRAKDGRFLVGELGRRNEQSVEIVPINPAYPASTVATGEVDWIARILWASQ